MLAGARRVPLGAPGPEAGRAGGPGGARGTFRARMHACMHCPAGGAVRAHVRAATRGPRVRRPWAVGSLWVTAGNPLWAGPPGVPPPGQLGPG